MAESIGDWAVKLTADASGMVSGLQAGASKVASFGTMAKTAATTVATATNNAVKSITQLDLSKQTAQLVGLGAAATGFIAGLATGGMAGAVAGITGLTQTLLNFATGSMGAIAGQVKLGRQLGITAQEAAGLQIASAQVGITNEAVEHGMVAWSNQVRILRQQLAHGGGPLVSALTNLGINAQNFSRAGIGEQMAMVAEATQRLPAGMDRNAAIMSVMGRRTSEIHGLLRLSANQLRDLGGLSASFGYSISQVDAEKVAGAMRELKQLGGFVSATFSMMGQGLAVMLAPVAAGVGGLIKELLTKARPLLDLMTMLAVMSFSPLIATIGLVLGAVRLLMPVFEAIGESIKIIKAAAIPVFMEIWEVISEVGSLIRDVWKSIFTGDMPNLLEMWKDGVILAARLISVSLQGLAGMVRMVKDAFQEFRQGAILGAAAAVPAGGPFANVSLGSPEQLARLREMVAAMQQAGLTQEQIMQRIRQGGNLSPLGESLDVRPIGNMAAEADRLRAILLGMPAPVGANALDHMQKVTEEFQKQLSQIGMTRDQIAVLEAERAGATAAQIQQMQAQQQVLNAATTLQGMRAQNAELQRSLGWSRLTREEQERQRVLDHFRRDNPNASAATIAELRAQQEITANLQKQQAEVEALNRMRQQGQQLTQQLRNPMEVFTDRMQELQNMRDRLGPQFDQTFERGLQQAVGNLQNAFPQRGPQSGPNAIMQGSVAAAQAINAAMRDAQSERRDPQREMLDIMREAREREIQQAEDARRMRQALEEGGFINVMRRN